MTREHPGTRWSQVEPVENHWSQDVPSRSSFDPEFLAILLVESSGSPNFRGTQQAQPQCEALEMGHV